jgi:hypothetical protein
MAYRDDLQASLEHVASLERDLEKTRAENAQDHERIAALEKQLAAAQQNRGPAAPPRKSGSATVIALVFGVIVASGIIAGIFFRVGGRSDGVKIVDLDGELPRATETAKRYVSDPELYKIVADHVASSGIADLATYHGQVKYGFLAGPRKATPGTNHADCAVDIRYRAMTMIYDETPYDGTACRERMPGPPRCTVREVWAEAIRRGAPQNGLAEIRFEMRTPSFNTGEIRSKPLWHFAITVAERKVFEMDLPDECPLGR